jgi:hypothetical protein
MGPKMLVVRLKASRFLKGMNGKVIYDPKTTGC